MQTVVSEKMIKAIQALAEEINPYQALSDKQLAALKRLRINETSNPFEITNRLLMLLDVLEEKAKKSKDSILQ